MDADNQALTDYAAWVAERRQRGLPTLPGRIDRERAINPFLRSDEASVRAALQQHCSLAATAAPVEAFAALRAWKDGFRG